MEEFFGWAKGVAGLRNVKLGWREKVGWLFTLAAAAYNLARMSNRMAATARCGREKPSNSPGKIDRGQAGCRQTTSEAAPLDRESNNAEIFGSSKAIL